MNVPLLCKRAGVLLWLTFGLACARAENDLVSWTNMVSGSWFTPENWMDTNSLNMLPSAATDALIDQLDQNNQGITITVGFNAAAAANLRISSDSLVINSGTLTTLTGASDSQVLVKGLAAAWNCSSNLNLGGPSVIQSHGLIQVGGTLNASDLTLQSGGQIHAQDSLLGDGLVEDYPTLWYTTNLFSVAGNLSVLNFAAVWDDTGKIGYGGSMTVSGPAARWTNRSRLIAGHLGYGDLTITNGGTVAGGEARVQSFSVITVTGAYSTWTNDAGLFIGNDPGDGSGGEGYLVVTNGGAVYSREAHLGADPFTSGFVTVTGPKSVWTSAGSLFIGNEGAGQMLVTNGAVVAAQATYLGYATNDSVPDDHSLIVDGTNSLVSSENVFVGFKSPGTLAVQNGGRVSCNTMDILPGSALRITDPGSSLVVAGTNGTLLVGNAPPDALQSGPGSLSIQNGGTVSDFYGYIDDGCFAYVNGAGSLWSTWTLDVGFATNGILNLSDGGMVTVGFGMGTVFVANGGTANSAGTILIGSSGSVGTLNCGTVQFGPSGRGNLVFDCSTTFSPNIAGNGNLIKLGNWTVILTGYNSWTGSSVVANGVLQVGNGGFDGTLGTANVAFTNTHGTAALVFNRLDNLAYSGLISGPGSVTNASGTITLGGKNTHTGRTTVLTNGVMVIAAESALGSNPASFVAGQLTLDGGTLETTATFAFKDANRGLAVTSSGGGFNTDFGTTLTISNTISGAGGVSKLGDGTLVFATTPTYKGTTFIVRGTLQQGAFSVIPNGAGRGNVYIFFLGTLDLGGQTAFLNGLSGDGIVDNTVPNTYATLFVGANNQSSTFNGRIRNSGGFISLLKTGTGTLTLTGNNTYSGGTTVSSGTLQLGAPEVIPDGPNAGGVTVNGTLDLAGFNETINGLSGTGIVDNTVGVGGTLRVGNNNQSSTFSGAIQNTVGQLYLNKIGSGTLTLKGASTYTGKTIINEGTLAIAVESLLGNNPPFLVADQLTLQGGTLESTASFAIDDPNRGIWLGFAGDGGTFNTDAGTSLTIANVISGLGGLTKKGAGTLILTADNSYLGPTLVTVGELIVHNGGNAGSIAGDVSVAPTGGVAALSGNGTIDGSVTCFGTSTLLHPGEGVGVLTINGNLSLKSGATTVFALGAVCDKAVVNGNLTLGGTLNIDDSAGFGAGVYTLFTYGGTLSGSLSIGTAPANYSYSFDTSAPGQVKLLVTSTVTRPQIGPVTLNAGKIIFQGTGGRSNAPFSILSTTNPALPSSQWGLLSTNQFDSNGNFSITNPVSANSPRQFYLLQVSP